MVPAGIWVGFIVSVYYYILLGNMHIFAQVKYCTRVNT